MPQPNNQPQSPKANNLPPGFVPLESPDATPTGAGSTGSSNLPPGFTPLETPPAGPDLSQRPSWWDTLKSGVQKAGQSAENWWTKPTPDVAPGNVPGVEQTLPTSTSPRTTFQRGAAIEGALGAPALVTGAVTAPVATALSLGGGAGGAAVLGKVGETAGEAVNAPTLGRDIGETAGMLFGSQAGRIPGRVIRSRVPRATQAYQETIAPGSSKAAEQLDDVETFKRAAPYLAEQQRTTPAKTTQPSGSFNPGQRMGVLNVAQNADAAGKTLWEQNILPRATPYAQVPIDHTAVAGDIQGTINPNAPADEARSGAVQRLIDFYNKPTTVGDALQKISALNEDKGLVAYENALPAKQAEMLNADPTLEAKAAARNSLLDQVFGGNKRDGTRVFGAIEKEGSPEEANYLREARKDWGALKQVSTNLGNAQVPTPESLPTRLMNTARLTVGGRGPHAYAGNLDTLLRLNDPNRLAVRSSELLGASELNPRQGPAIRTSPWAPPAPAQLPPAPPPPQTPVGTLPPAGFPATLPDQMWTGRSTPSAPTWGVPGTSVPATGPGIQPTAVDLPDVLNVQGGQPPQASPTTDLSAAPKVPPSATVLPESVRPDEVDKAVHPWQSDARVEKKVGELQRGESDATIVARKNPDGTVSPVKGHQSPVAAARTGQPVNVVDAGPITDGEKAAMTAESHFFPQNDRAVPADMGKDAASERASLPEEVQNAPALPAKEGPASDIVQRGNLPERLGPERRVSQGPYEGPDRRMRTSTGQMLYENTHREAEQRWRDIAAEQSKKKK